MAIRSNSEAAVTAALDAAATALSGLVGGTAIQRCLAPVAELVALGALRSDVGGAHGRAAQGGVGFADAAELGVVERLLDRIPGCALTELTGTELARARAARSRMRGLVWTLSRLGEELATELCRELGSASAVVAAFSAAGGAYQRRDGYDPAAPVDRAALAALIRERCVGKKPALKGEAAVAAAVRAALAAIERAFRQANETPAPWAVEFIDRFREWAGVDNFKISVSEAAPAPSAQPAGRKPSADAAAAQQKNAEAPSATGSAQPSEAECSGDAAAAQQASSQPGRKRGNLSKSEPSQPENFAATVAAPQHIRQAAETAPGGASEPKKKVARKVRVI